MMAKRAEGIEAILARIDKKEDQELVRQAHEFAATAHKDQLRESGDPYISHSLAVARLLSDLGVDPETVAAGLLHDVVEDCESVTVEDLVEVFGLDVARLVDGVTKLEEMGRLGRLGGDRDEQELENLRKVFVEMARDARVMLIKLADRLHNMRTIKPLSPARQRRLAQETLDIYAPLANRLGIWRWKQELEDLAFECLDPDTYYEIVSQLAARQEMREVEIGHYIRHLEHHLRLEGIEARVTGRPKHIYSIYRKMQRKHIPLERVYDIRAIRVIVEDVPDCYHTLGIVHSLWVPIPGEFDDYIATPKPNMYQSLHTAVVTERGQTLEVQIRTNYMNRIAEYGIAAHWQYKEGGRASRHLAERIAALRAQIEASREEGEDAGQFVDALRSDVLQERVYVFTPKGKVIDLPSGATPIDFAFHVHTEIGYRCRGAKVNGRWVPLDYVLHTGDQVEIVTAKRAAPSRDWLNPDLGYVKTARAQAKIRRWFRQQDREENITTGRMILERELKRLGLFPSYETVATLFGYEDTDEFLARIGFGDIHVSQITSRVVGAEREKGEKEIEMLPSAPSPNPTPPEIQVLGTGQVLTRLARCCNPLPGEPIVGYVTRGRGISIHRRDCPNVLNVWDTERLIEVAWGTEVQTFPVRVYILAHDRAGLLHDITGLISTEKINIASLHHGRRDSTNLVTLYITIDVTDIDQLRRVLARLARIPNVLEVRRYTQ